MRKYLIALSTATALATTPAIARDGETYIGIEGGIVMPNDIQFDVTGARVGTANVNNSNGWEVGGVLGHDFGAIRLEGEAAYKDFGTDEVNAIGAPIPGATAPGATGLYTNITGGADISTLMLNALLDFGGNCPSSEHLAQCAA